MNNKNGFTLVEMIVSLAILAFVSVTITTSLVYILDLELDTRKKREDITVATDVVNGNSNANTTVSSEDVTDFEIEFSTNNGSITMTDTISVKEFLTENDVILRYFVKRT